MVSSVHALSSLLDSGFALDTDFGPITARAVSHRDFSLNVFKISPVQFSCVAEEPPPFDEGDEVSLRLSYLPGGEETPPVTVRIEQIRAIGASFRLVGTVTRHSFPAMTGLSGLMAEIIESDGFVPTGDKGRFRETIDDPEMVREVIHTLIANGVEGIIHSGNGVDDIQDIKAMRFDPDFELPIHWRVLDPWPKAPFVVEATSYNSVYFIPVDRVRRIDDLMATDFPREITRYRSRTTRRVKENSIKISFQHPEFKELRVQRHTHDVSQYGLSFLTEMSEDWMYPGLEIPAIVVSAGKRGTLLQGVVRHVSYSHKEHAIVCGVEIECRSPFHSRLGWAHIIEPLLHPNTQRGSRENADDVWDVYDKSGYFQLSGKKTEDFAALRENYKDVWGSFGKTPALGCQVLWNSAYRLEATASVMLMYSGTWLFYQLGRRKGRSVVGVPGRELVRDAYVHAFEHAQWYPTLEWMLTYIEANVRWHQVTHQAFADRYAHTGKVLNIPFRLMEDTACAPAPDWQPTYEIGEATMEELELFIEHVRKVYPAPVVDALDLSPAKFYLEDVNATLVGAQLDRQRTMYVARKNGRAVAAALYETGSPGMHLFRLVDGVRLFAFQEDDAEAALMELIEHARGWYAEQGRDIFVYFIEDWQRGIAEKAEFRDLGEGRMWMVHSSLVSDFLEHIHRLTAPRDIAPLVSQIPGAEGRPKE